MQELRRIFLKPATAPTNRGHFGELFLASRRFAAAL
jgi:hypothetical protein